MVLSASIEIGTVSLTNFTVAKKEGDGRDVERHPMIRASDLSQATRRAMVCERFLDRRCYLTAMRRKKKRTVHCIDGSITDVRQRNEWQTTDSLRDITC